MCAPSPRLLKLEVAELERSLGVTRRIVPQVPLLDADVAGLQRALLQARREAEQLSAALESPANMSRWRLLEGKVRFVGGCPLLCFTLSLSLSALATSPCLQIPDREELGAKIQVGGKGCHAQSEAAAIGQAGHGFYTRCCCGQDAPRYSSLRNLALTVLVFATCAWPLQALEERLNDKKEQLLEKELILEEITALSDKLRVQVRTFASARAFPRICGALLQSRIV
jgi:hypothetical protein